ncbi:MAG TPA: hypothetical protein VGN81_27500 [Pseudonocardiaceae bacterium]|jgi:hypothetical protein
MTSSSAQQLNGQDVRTLSDLVLASVVLHNFSNKHVDLPSPRSACPDS